MTRHLTFEQLLDLTGQLSGEQTPREFGVLDAAVARHASHRFGTDSYGTLPLKAAALAHTLARLEPFEDSPKNIAFTRLALYAFLTTNNVVLTADDRQVGSWLYAVSLDQLDLLGLARNIRAHSGSL